MGSLTSFDSPFDQAVRTANKGYIDKHVVKGFNLFMGKAACGTCHFAPVFNGTTPPFYFESEAEVLGVPQNFSKILRTYATMYKQPWGLF